MLIGVVVAVLVGYIAGATRQDERRKWAETEAKVFEQQNQLLASCMSDRNQAVALCKDEKQQIASAHLELIRAYKERDDACRAAGQGSTPPGGSSVRAPAAPPTSPGAVR